MKIRPDIEKFRSKECIDFFGTEIEVGDRLAKPTNYVDSPFIEMRTVTKIHNGRIFLDDSKTPIQFPGRCINISAMGDGRTNEA